MGLFIKETGNRTISMAEEDSYFQMDSYMKDHGSMEKDRERES